jgi:Uma2 family endonuclease
MTAITELSQLDLNGTYTYADYLRWQFEERIELIKGKIMAMTAPNLKHQRYSGRLSLPIANFLRGKKCELFIAPFDVKLYDRRKAHLPDDKTYSVVQPDLCVICDKTKLTERGCDGAPEWIIEILSPSNSKREMRFKFDLYEESGVIDYWLVYPYEQAVYQFVLNAQSEKYVLHGMYANDDVITPFLFPELQIDLAEVFAEVE